MNIRSIIRTMVRITAMVSVSFLLLKLGGEILSLSSANKNLKLQLQLMAQRAEEVVQMQHRTLADLRDLQERVDEQARATFAKVHVEPEIESVMTAGELRSYRYQRGVSTALSGMDAVRSNYGVIEQTIAAFREGVEKRAEALAKVPSILPADGWVSSSFGYRRAPTTGKRRFHKGTDIAARQGSPVVAAADGVVIDAGWRGAYGKVVEIDHGNSLTTLYAHAGRVYVQTGDKVARGQKIAAVGNTGRSTGAHLHYEVRRAGKPVNPGRFLRVAEQQLFDGRLDTLAIVPQQPSFLAAESFGPEEPVISEDPLLSQNQSQPLEPVIAALVATTPVQGALPDFAHQGSMASSVEHAGVARSHSSLLGLFLLIATFLLVSQSLLRGHRAIRDRLALAPAKLFSAAVEREPGVNRTKPVRYW